MFTISVCPDKESLIPSACILDESDLSTLPGIKDFNWSEHAWCTSAPEPSEPDQ